MKRFTLFIFRKEVLKISSIFLCVNTATINYPNDFEVSLNQSKNVSCATWTGNINTDWNTGGNWCGGNIPSATDDIIIPTGVFNYPVITTGVNALAASITINNAASLIINGSGNITLSSGGIFINDGTFNASGSGAVIFAGSGSVKGTVSFNNVIINGAVDFGTASTVTGILLLNTGGSASGASTHLVTFSSSSTLIYNETVTTGNEWYTGGSGTTSAGAGIPQNITIQYGIVTIPNAGGNNRAIAGNLNIASGAALQMTTGSRDLFLAGNWSNNGTFNANGRKVTFNATTGTQSVSGSTTFFDLALNNLGATTDFGNSVITINNEFRTSNGTMNGNASTFIFTGSPSVLEGARTKFFYNLQINSSASLSDLTASAGNTHISNSFINNGTFTQFASHTTYFDKSDATETLSGSGVTTFGKLTIGGANLSLPTTLNANSHNFIITGGSLNLTVGSIFNANANTITFSNLDATISGTGTANLYNVITNVPLDLGSGISTINNNLQINTGGSIINNAPGYGSSATLTYNTATVNYANGTEWNGTSTNPGAGVPKNVTIQNTNKVFLSNNRGLSGILNILPGASLGLNDNTLTLNGQITGTGTITGSTNSNLIIGSTGNLGTLYFDQLIDNVTNVLKNLTVNNGAVANLGNILNITSGTSPNSFGILTVNGTLNTNDNLILKSNAYGDAVVGESYGTISGNVVVERYIPARRAWRFITAPVNSTQTINDAWQEGQVNTGFASGETFDLYPGFGTEITYNNLTSDGYDWNTTYNPSIRYWDPILKDYVPLPAGGTKATYVNDFPAYYFFIRGSRSIDLSNGITAPNATTLRVTGTLAENGDNTGNTIKTTSTTIPANGYFLVGNPYASPVDLSKILDGSRTNSSGYNPNHFWIWDPAISGTYGVGGYVAYSTGMFAPVNNPDDITGSIIQSSQGFMVQSNNTTSGSSISLEFREEDKTVSETQVFGKQFQQTPPAFYTNLMIQSGDSLIMTDGVSAAFGKDNSAGIDEKDASKKWNTGEGIGLYRLGTWNAIEFRPVPVVTDTLFYYLNNMQQHNYTLKIMTKNIPTGFPQAWLADTYLNTRVAVTPGLPLLYNFTATSDVNTFRNRFMLVFRRKLIATPVPVTKVASIANPGTTGNANSITNKVSNVSIYPNPAAAGKKIILQFTNMIEASYHITITNELGKAVIEKNIIHNNSSNTYSLQTGAGWAAGNYFVKITNGNGFNIVIKLFVRK
jgi:hypothetical protein